MKTRNKQRRQGRRRFAPLVKEMTPSRSSEERRRLFKQAMWGGFEDSPIAEENTRLKRLVADQAVQIQILQEVNSKKW